MKTPNNFEEKLEEVLENFYIDLIGGCPEKKDYYFIKKSVKAISTLCEEEVKRALSNELLILQTSRINHKCICCTSNFDKIAFRISKLAELKGKE